MEWKFETYVEKIKFDVLREVARACYAGNFKDVETKLPEILVPGRKANYRCCVYMERAIMAERIKIVRGGEWDDFNIIDVIPIACDQCPMGGYTVTESCRGCIGHACKQACPKNAITVDGHHRAHIDKEKCVNCGLCAKACPFGAIYNFRRPCQKACPVGAITMDENLSAKIDYSKCITCGQCTQKCPFGAIAAKTFMTFLIDHIRNNILSTKKRPIIAMVAPSIAAQFPSVSIEQIIEAITQLGFSHVVEVAAGADIVAKHETKELAQKKLLFTSCCPAFFEYVKRFHPELKDRISASLSPMATLGKVLKQKYPDSLTVFIGPCTAKKAERNRPEVRPYVDYVLTFTELRAMFSARDIEIESLQGKPFDTASPFGRGFGRVGGVSEAVIEGLKELNIKDFKLSSLACSGLKECIRAVDAISAGERKYNFIEGMACEGGCICGPESLNHNYSVGRAYMQSHSRKATNKKILDSIKVNGDVEEETPFVMPSTTQPGMQQTEFGGQNGLNEPKPQPKSMSVEEMIKKAETPSSGRVDAESRGPIPNQPGRRHRTEEKKVAPATSTPQPEVKVEQPQPDQKKPFNNLTKEDLAKPLPAAQPAAKPVVKTPVQEAMEKIANQSKPEEKKDVQK